MPQDTSKTKAAVLISGSGRTLRNLITLSREGRLPIEIVLVISTRRDVLGNERAVRAGLPLEIVPRKELADEEFSRRITAALDAAGAELVIMAGFTSRWEIPPHYEGRVLNIHPALLPRFGGKGFYGDRVHRAVLEAREEYTGCTVHFCDNQYDNGPIILQRRIPVLPDDTPEMLAVRVFEQECQALPEAIRLFCEGRLRLRDGKVEILPASGETQVVME